MRSWVIIGCAVLAGILLAVGISMWGSPQATSQVDAIQVQDAGPQDRGPGRGNRFGGGPGGPGGPGIMPGGMFTQIRGSFAETLTLIAEASLNPSFNLTNEQRQKIQAIRTEVKSARDKWAKEHADDFKKLADQFAAARDAAQRDQLRELFQKRQDLLASAPNESSAASQLKALLTAEQLKMLDAYVAEKRKEEEEQRQQLGNFYGGGRSGPGGPPSNAPATQPARPPGA